jgi:copper resistance protein C
MRRVGVRVRHAVVLVAASAALVLLPAMTASAHNFVVATTPAEGSTVTEQPGTVSLTTNDELLDFGENTLQVVGPDGRHYETACATVDEATAEVPAELGPAGAYTVVWQVVSTDGHPISGEFAFDWAPAPGQTVGTGSDAAPCDSSGSADGAGGTGSASATPSEEPAESAAMPLGDVLWIAGGAVAVVAAALATWLIVRRKA